MPELEIEQLSKLDAWLRSILWDGTLPRAGSTLVENRTLEIHRLKARLPFSNGDIKIVQGVREIFEILDGPKVDHFDSAAAALSRGKIVLIGRELIDVPFEESFRNTVMSR